MTSILSLAVLGSWSYAGFLAEPAPAPAATKVPEASAPSLPKPSTIASEPAPKPDPDPKPEPEPEPAAPEPPPVAPSASITSSPPRYRLSDASGQAWEHADPNYLRSFVDTRNRSFATRVNYSAPTYRASRCVTGRCN
jgi:hypothetical protein